MAKASKPTSDFFTRVHEVARMVPRGRVTTYGAIGEYIGGRISARMVGWAMNAAHNAMPAVPAHRVVNRNGLLTGKMHFATPTLMQELLQSEGVEVVDDQIQNFENVRWQPQKS
jgi:methylated-DNA-protein-cysteine methyltransferase related protein